MINDIILSQKILIKNYNDEKYKPITLSSYYQNQICDEFTLY